MGELSVLVGGVVAIGLLHGVLPDHGWPIAAAYALERPNRWLAGVTAGLVIGIGHLVSSIALVLVVFWLQGTYDIVGSNLVQYASGTLLVILGGYEYVSGHGHAHLANHDHGHRHDNHSHGTHAPHDHGSNPEEAHSSGPDDGGPAEARGLWNLGVAALVLGIAHEEPIQIIAICGPTPYCLELMLVYSLAVIAAILGPTLLLVAGYERYRERLERVEPYLSSVTGVVLVVMGIAFLIGIV